MTRYAHWIFALLLLILIVFLWKITVNTAHRQSTTCVTAGGVLTRDGCLRRDTFVGTSR